MTHIRICKEERCADAATTKGYCRLHYLCHWRMIREEERRRAMKKLNRYIEHMVRRHPEGYVDEIRKELGSPDFERSVHELFGGSDDPADPFVEGQASDEELEKLIRKLKVEKGY